MQRDGPRSRINPNNSYNNCFFFKKKFFFFLRSPKRLNLEQHKCLLGGLKGLRITPIKTSRLEKVIFNKKKSPYWYRVLLLAVCTIFRAHYISK